MCAYNIIIFYIIMSNYDAFSFLSNMPMTVTPFQLCGAGLERNRTRKAKRNTPIRVMTSCHGDLGMGPGAAGAWMYPLGLHGRSMAKLSATAKTCELVLRLVTCSKDQRVPSWQESTSCPSGKLKQNSKSNRLAPKHQGRPNTSIEYG